MKTTKHIYILMISLLTVACGGGGGEDSSVAPQSTAPVLIDVVGTDTDTDDDTVPYPDAIYDTTAELVVAKSFLINAEFDLNIRYDSDDGRNRYLSICTEFTEGEKMKVDYGSCLLRTSSQGSYSTTITVANDKKRLVMAIWDLDDMESPRYEIWENDLSNNNPKNFVVN